MSTQTAVLEAATIGQQCKVLHLPGVTPFQWTVLGCGTKSPADDSFRS